MEIIKTIRFFDSDLIFQIKLDVNLSKDKIDMIKSCILSRTTDGSMILMNSKNQPISPSFGMVSLTMSSPKKWMDLPIDYEGEETSQWSKSRLVKVRIVDPNYLRGETINTIIDGKDN